MQLIRFNDVQKFYDASRAYLTKREAQNNLILGLTTSLLEDPKAFGEEFPYMALVQDEENVVAAVLRTPPHWPHISYVEDETAISLVTASLHKEYGKLPGVSGIAPFSRQLAENWTAITGEPFSQQMSQGIYRLTKVIPVKGVSGSMRPIIEADRPILREWFKGFDKDSFGNEMTDQEADRNIARRFHDPTRSLFIWQDGEPVSMAGTSGPTPNGIRINAVYTPPEHRRKGYASACVAELSQLMLDQGRKLCFLFTDMANPTSNHIYQTIGYESVGIAEPYSFDAPSD